jgi:hypothetical protein
LVKNAGTGKRMTFRKPDRILTVVQQSLGKRTRPVQVEIIPSAQPKLKKKRRPHKVKNTRSQNPVMTIPEDKSKKVGKPKRRRSGSSFLGSTPARSPIAIGKSKKRGLGPSSSDSHAGTSPPAGGPSKAEGPKKSKRGQVSRAGWSGYGEPSAGLPGNEEADPPRRSSGSTPGDRWLDQIKR